MIDIGMYVALGFLLASLLALMVAPAFWQRGDIDQLRGALEGEAATSRRSSKSDATLAKENRRLSAELSKIKQELADGRIGGNENGLLRGELRKPPRPAPARGPGARRTGASLRAGSGLRQQKWWRRARRGSASRAAGRGTAARALGR